MKGRALILIFLFLIMLCTPVSANIFTNPSMEYPIEQYQVPQGWTRSASVFYTHEHINSTSYDGECCYYMHDGSYPETGGLEQDVDLTGIDTINVYTKISGGSSGNNYMSITAGGLYSRNYGAHDWTRLSLDVSSLSGVQTVEIWGYYNSGTAPSYYMDLAFDGDDPYPDTITLNKSSYNDPENVQINAELYDYDPTNYSYTVRLYGYTYGGWGALTQVDYNESTAMTASNKSIVADINADWYDLPLYIKAVITEFDKSDYSTTETAVSNMVYYHVAQGYSYATLNYNQSYYTDPEQVGVNYSIDGMDTNNFEYWIEVMGNDGSCNTWIGVNEEYIELSSSSGQSVFTINKQWLNLPMNIKAYLYIYSKSTGEITTLASTSEAVYNPESIAPGTIWTDKSEYNVTELVEISYTTNVTDNYIAVEEPYSIWSTHNVPLGTYSFLYELSTSAVGNTDIYLFENGELVDQVTISVSSESGDDAYAAWMKDYYYTGEIANFYYYSSNTSAQITVYDGADVVVFGPATTQLGYHNGMVNTANTNPGTFLVSLYHNGTYYNDTMMFESVDSWVRFDSSKYYVGGTINIEYYLSDPTQQISMWDANQGLVIRFTTNNGILVSGSMQTVPFTLSENNEYSYDVPGKLSSGELKLGFWKIFIEDNNGVFVGDSWDETYVCEATDDDGSYGTDTSNEMISIFFSPEGVFMLYTVCLTMMGLVLAKHPAGGGAGATVGVGFGTYFNVLPVWMLMLTVILLVVMAGVSIAVYYKGK